MLKKGIACVLSCAVAMSLCAPYAAETADNDDFRINIDMNNEYASDAEKPENAANENAGGEVSEDKKDEVKTEASENGETENVGKTEENGTTEENGKSEETGNADAEKKTDENASENNGGADNNAENNAENNADADLTEQNVLSISLENAAITFAAAGVLGNEIDMNEYTDEMTDNNGKYECVNFGPFGDTNASDQARYTDTTIYGLKELNTEAYVVYKAAGDRVFTNINAVCYTRDGGQKAKIYTSADGETYTDLNATWSHNGQGGSRPNCDAYWSDLNGYVKDFTVADGIKFIKIVSQGEDKRTDFKLGDITLKTTDPNVEMPEPDAPAGYGATIDEDSVTDELGTTEYMFDCVNLSEYTADIDQWTDKTLLGFTNLGKEGYIIYKAGENRVFSEVEVKGYTRDGGKVGYVYVSSDGWEYEKVADPTSGWSSSGRGGSGANDAGWSEGFSTKKTFAADDNIRYIKVYHPGEGARQKFKFGYTKLATTDLSKGCVIGDVYEETFESDYHIYELDGAKLDGGKLSAGSGSVRYKALPKRELTEVELLAEGTSWSGKLEAFDKNGNKIRIEKAVTTNAEGSGVRVSAELPSGCVYIKISGGTYSEIKISSQAAVGAEWSYTTEGATITAEVSGTVSETLKNGCTVSFSVPIKNTSSKKQKAKAYLCVFNGDRMDKIEEFDIEIKSGKTETAEGTMTLDTVTADTKVTLFIWTDLETMIPLGDTKSFGDK